ncbi:hypothetical protein RUM44_010229 [Polyplax serrata]|uniref:Ubiquitin-like domain-containing protein n=1 Tax=Polyplax serrata TaxID=468196 RepID=A0ABR1AUX8_POLSC
MESKSPDGNLPTQPRPWNQQQFLLQSKQELDVFLMIRRKKLTIFTDCKDSTSVLELKKMIEGILKIAPENQQLFKDNQIMEDDKSLQEYGLIPNVAKAQCPAPLGLALRLEPEGDFEPLEITPLSSPPDLPDVMKVPEANGQESVA